MAYDRYDTRDAPRDERSRWPNDRDFDRNRNRRGDDRGFYGRRDERGFFERAGDEIASWFGDEDAERRRREDEMREERERGFRSRDREHGGSWNRERESGADEDRDRGRRDWFETRGPNERGGFGESDY